jgi:hypothetical protein
MLSFYAAIDCHWRSSLRDLHSNLAVIVVIFCQNDSVAPATEVLLQLGRSYSRAGRRLPEAAAVFAAAARLAPADRCLLYLAGAEAAPAASRRA